MLNAVCAASATRIGCCHACAQRRIARGRHVLASAQREKKGWGEPWGYTLEDSDFSLQERSSKGRQVRTEARNKRNEQGERQGDASDSSDDPDITLNPVELGRRSRQAIEDAWAGLTGLTTPRASFMLDDDFGAGADMQYPEAEFTQVLVVGGTGRVGRIVVRKLLLRGYTVRVMCRDTKNTASALLPSSVELIRGDVGNLQDCRKAVQGMDKIIYCATSQLQLTSEIEKVDNMGPSNIARTWIDSKFVAATRARTVTKESKIMIADFSTEPIQNVWDLMNVGRREQESGSYSQDTANALLTADLARLAFEGSIASRTGYAEWGGPSGDLGDCEALVVRCVGYNKPYFCVLQDVEGYTYSQRFLTRNGFKTVWLPFNRFRAERPEYPPLRPGMVTAIKFRFDKMSVPVEKPSDNGEPAQPSFRDMLNRGFFTVEEEMEAQEEDPRNIFAFELAYIKAQPVSSEVSFVLVSAANQAGADAQYGEDAEAAAQRGSFAGPEANVLGVAEGVNARRVMMKRRGEMRLRESGVGFCIVRPSRLLQEPGGYKALVFDQADRISEGVGYADVADVCLRALHAPEAVNKTFEVCYEFDDGESMEYELVAQKRDRNKALLDKALANLERNTV